jgi:hypothetical protein
MPLTKATTNVVNLDKDTIINGLTVGRGGGDQGTNVALGLNALSVNISGQKNTSVGEFSMYNNTTGIQNTAIGSNALAFNVGASNNTAIGYQAIQQNVSGANNTACGWYALANNITGGQNVAVGISALLNTNTSNNVGVGGNALSVNTSGAFNTAIGYNCLNIANGASNISAIGYNAQVTGSDQIQLGNPSTTTYAYGAVQDRSDIRDKADVRNTELGLEFVNALRPVDFKWDMREDYRPEAPTPVIKPADLKDDATEEEKAKYAQELAAYNAYKVELDKWLEDVKLANITHDGSKKRNRFHHGLIAQEVKAVLDAKGIDFGGFQDHSVKGGDDVLSIGYIELIAPLIKAVQELSAKVAELEAK